MSFYEILGYGIFGGITGSFVILTIWNIMRHFK